MSDSIRFTIYGKEYTISNYAKEIRLKDVLENIKGIDSSILTKIYNQIAGEDGVMQGTELEAFFKKLDKFNGEDKELTNKELQKFNDSRATSMASMYNKPFYEEFIKQIISLNDKIIQKEKNKPQPQKEGEDNFYENGKLAKKIIKKPYATIEQEYKQGKVVHEVHKDLKGKVTQDVTFDKEGNKTYHTRKNDGTETFKTFNKDKKLIAEGSVGADKEKVTNYLDASGKKTKTVTKGKDYTRTENYKGDYVDNETYVSNSGYTTHTKYTRDENGQLVKSVETAKKIDKDTKKPAVDSVTTTQYYPGGYNVHVKTIKNNIDKRTAFEYYHNNNEYEPYKIVEKDFNGNLISTTENTFDSDGKKTQTVEKNKNDKVISTTTYKYRKEEDLPYEEKTVIADGTTTIIKYSRNHSSNPTEETITRANGEKEYTKYNPNVFLQEQEKVIDYPDGRKETTTYSYFPGKDHDLKEAITKDGNNVELKRTTWFITPGGKKSEDRIKGTLVSTTVFVSNSDTTIEYLHENNRVVATAERNYRKNVEIYKDIIGHEITYKEFDKLSRTLTERAQNKER